MSSSSDRQVQDQLGCCVSGESQNSVLVSGRKDNGERIVIPCGAAACPPLAPVRSPGSR